MVSLTNCDIIRCDICPVKVQERYLKRHIQLCHVEDVKKLRKPGLKYKRKYKQFKCGLCDKVYRSDWQLQKHQNYVHFGLKTFQCRFCEKSYSDETPLRNHIDIVHCESGKFDCDECDKSFPKIYYLKSHKRRIHKLAGANVTCKICNNQVFKYDINDHVRAHLNLEKDAFKCPQCDKIFPRRKQLEIHSQTHSNVRTISCDKCDSKFKLKGYLTKHIKTIHNKSELGKWICALCQKKFSSQGALHIHKRTHAEKQFECSMCDMKFAQRCTLKVHIKAIHLK